MQNSQKITKNTSNTHSFLNFLNFFSNFCFDSKFKKTSDFGSGCSADGNIIIQKSIYPQMVAALQAEGGYLCNAEEKAMLEAAMWDEKGNRTFPTIACHPQQIAAVAGFSIPEEVKFLMVENQGQIGPQHKLINRFHKQPNFLQRYHACHTNTGIVHGPDQMRLSP